MGSPQVACVCLSAMYSAFLAVLLGRAPPTHSLRQCFQVVLLNLAHKSGVCGVAHVSHVSSDNLITTLHASLEGQWLS